MLNEPRDSLSTSLIALAHPVRRGVLDRLRASPARVTDLAAGFDISLAAVSRHVRVLEDAGLVISGTSPDTKLVEFIELPSEVHPYFVATQAHPELKSRPTRPHPLFVGLVEAALDRKLATRLPVDDDHR